MRSGRRRPGSRTGSAATNAFAIEFDNVSHGTPVALRLCRDCLVAEPELRRVLLVAASRESYLLDYTNERSRFMFNFGDGAAAALLERDAGGNEMLGSHAITDGSFSLQVKVPSGGSVEPACGRRRQRRYPRRRRPGGDEGRARRDEPRQLRRGREGALERSGRDAGRRVVLCGIHMKRSMHDAIVDGSASTRRARRTSTTRAT